MIKEIIKEIIKEMETAINLADFISFLRYGSD